MNEKTIIELASDYSLQKYQFSNSPFFVLSTSPFDPVKKNLLVIDDDYIKIRTLLEASFRFI